VADVKLCRLSTGKGAGLALLIVIAGWMCMPILQASHLEVLSAQMEINAIAANEGRLADANVQYPIHTEYFYLSRIGVTFMLQCLMRWLGNGDAGFRLLTQVSFVVFVAATIYIARRFGGVSRIAAGAALLLTPGIAPLGFLFTDSIVSLGLGMAGLALLPRVGPVDGRLVFLRATASGCALGAATLARVDGLLLLPIAAGMAWIEGRRWRDMLRLALPVSIGLLSTLLLSWALSGHSLAESLTIGRHFDALHTQFRSGVLLFAACGMFFGLLNSVLLPLGVLAGWRTFDFKRRLVLIGLPVGLTAYFLMHAVEVRHLYPLLSPFVAILGGKGLEGLSRALRRPDLQRRFAAACAFVFFGAMVWLAPPLYVPVREGPRPVVGQLWSPVLWRRWHSGMEELLNNADVPLRRAEEASWVGVLTLEANADAFLRLRLWQRGFRPLPIELAAPGCHEAVEGWAKGSHRVLVARTENPHLMAREQDDYVTALLLSSALQCAALRNIDPLFAAGIRGWGQSAIRRFVESEVPALDVKQVFFGWPGRIAHPLAEKTFSRLWRVPTHGYVQQTVLLTPGQADKLAQAADADVAAYRDKAATPLSDYSELMQQFLPRIWNPGSTR
jgi:hypothetical protein